MYRSSSAAQAPSDRLSGARSNSSLYWISIRISFSSIIRFPPKPVCSRTAAGAAAGVALQARAIAHQREVAAFAAAVAFVTLHARLLHLCEARIGRRDFDRRRDGERAREQRHVGLGLSRAFAARARSALAAALQDSELVADKAVGRDTLHHRGDR